MTFLVSAKMSSLSLTSKSSRYCYSLPAILTTGLDSRKGIPCYSLKFLIALGTMKEMKAWKDGKTVDTNYA